MPQTKSVHISFASKHPELRKALSTVVCIGNTLPTVKQSSPTCSRWMMNLPVEEESWL